jgi:hypothetical protein
MKRYRHTLIPVTAFLILTCLLSTLLPVSNALWMEVLSISGYGESQVGIKIAVTKTATGFSEEQEGITIIGLRGEICVANSGNYPTQDLTILDTLQYRIGAGELQDYLTIPIDISVKPVIGPMEGYCYPYEFVLEPIQEEAVSYRNITRVTIINHADWLPGGKNCDGPPTCPFGPEYFIEFIFKEGAVILTESSNTEPILIISPPEESIVIPTPTVTSTATQIEPTPTPTIQPSPTETIEAEPPTPELLPTEMELIETEPAPTELPSEPPP